MQVILCTSNPFKVDEYKRLLGDSHEYVTVKQIEVDETEISFVGNSTLKVLAYSAEYAFKYPDAYFVGDDAGVSIPSLGGFPGLFSKRVGEDLADRVKTINRMVKSGSDDYRSIVPADLVCAVTVHKPNAGMKSVISTWRLDMHLKRYYKRGVQTYEPALFFNDMPLSELKERFWYDYYENAPRPRSLRRALNTLERQ